MAVAFLAYILSQAGIAKADSIGNTNRLLGIILPYSFTSRTLRKIFDSIGQKHLGSYFIEAKPGASGLLATKHLLTQSNTQLNVLVSTTSTSALNYLLKPDISPNPIEVFQPLGIICEYNAALITARHDISSFDDLIRIAKNSPGSLNVATPGVGSLYHVLYLVMAKLFGIDATHIPYSTGKHAFSIYNRDTDFGFVSVPEALAWQQANRVNILAVTSRKRIYELPQVPSVTELHPKFVVNDYISLVAKKGLPAEFCQLINGYLHEVLQLKEVQSEFLRYGYISPQSTSIEFHRQKMISEIQFWQNIIKDIPSGKL